MSTDDVVLAKFEETTVEALRHQLQTLNTILHRNGTVRYLRPFLHGGGDRGLNCRTPPPEDFDAEEFRRRVPLSTYEDYRHLIDRMAHEKSEELHDDDDDPRRSLSADPLVCFYRSSGTTSTHPKLVPHHDSSPSKSATSLVYQASGAVLRRRFPPRPSANKVLWFIYAGNVTPTPGGLNSMALSSFLLLSDEAFLSQYFTSCVAPAEAIMGSDLRQQIYCYLLCGLRKRDLIDGIRAPYAVGLMRAFSLLESKWAQICEDIEKGVPSLEITDEKMRKSVAEVLGGPNPDLADEVRSICEKEDWNGIVAKLWPNARYMKCVSTGSLSHHYRKLKDYAGPLPLLGGDYLASECCIGLNLDISQPPERTRYVVVPTAAYFEFIPFDVETNRADVEGTVGFSGVEVGRLYEVVVTTYGGLYRFRLGDIVRVVGFHNACPEVEFVMRTPKSTVEIVTESVLAKAIENLQLALGNEWIKEIVDFSCFMDSELKPKQLKIFIEVREGCMLLQKDKTHEATAALMKCCDLLDESMGHLYEVEKEKGEIGPLLLLILKPGTSDELFQMATENDIPASQYKPPKIIRNKKIVDLMGRNVALTVSLSSSDC